MHIQLVSQLFFTQDSWDEVLPEILHSKVSRPSAKLTELFYQLAPSFYAETGMSLPLSDLTLKRDLRIADLWMIIKIAL